jgi:quercetin dioxygenase-like cupin family protein
MDERELAKKLVREGFTQTFVWEDRPNAFYPEHTHADETAHIILNGDLALTMNGKTETCRAGGRCDVPAGAMHSAKIGSQGCRYLIGEKRS